ncbi:MAG: cadherin repeat domain-containing protein [Pseudomonadota bacterium]
MHFSRPGAVVATLTLAACMDGEVEEPPLTFLASGAIAVEETSTGMASISTFAVAGGGAPDARFGIVGGADAALFSIDPVTGALSVPAGPLDFEAPSDADGDGVYEAVVEARSGVRFATLDVRLAVSDGPDSGLARLRGDREGYAIAPGLVRLTDFNTDGVADLAFSEVANTGWLSLGSADETVRAYVVSGSSLASGALADVAMSDLPTEAVVRFDGPRFDNDLLGSYAQLLSALAETPSSDALVFLAGELDGWGDPSCQYCELAYVLSPMAGDEYASRSVIDLNTEQDRVAFAVSVEASNPFSSPSLLAATDDIDGDGRGELLEHRRYREGISGRVDETALWSRLETSAGGAPVGGDRLMRLAPACIDRVAVADFDGDAIPDLLTSCDEQERSEADGGEIDIAEIRIVFGASLGPDLDIDANLQTSGAVARVRESTVQLNGESVGAFAAPTVDYDGDGLSEIVVAAPIVDESEPSSVGAAAIIRGRVLTAGSDLDFENLGGDVLRLVLPDDYLAVREARDVGDVTGDGVSDIALAVARRDFPCGSPVSSGFCEVVILDPGALRPDTNRGEVWIVSGRRIADMLSAGETYAELARESANDVVIIRGLNSSSRLGNVGYMSVQPNAGLISLGDLDLDGVNELALSDAYASIQGGYPLGGVYIVPGWMIRNAASRGEAIEFAAAFPDSGG